MRDAVTVADDATRYIDAPDIPATLLSNSARKPAPLSQCEPASQGWLGETRASESRVDYRAVWSSGPKREKRRRRRTLRGSPRRPSVRPGVLALCSRNRSSHHSSHRSRNRFVFLAALLF